jgi:excinuclease UvrABC nuclease subunit
MLAARLNLWVDIPTIPASAGIYRLRVLTTNAIYIGSSINMRRRCRDWHKVANNSLATVGTKRITRMVHRSLARDWVFEVLEETPNLNVKELRALELQTIQAHTHLGELLLNANLK